MKEEPDLVLVKEEPGHGVKRRRLWRDSSSPVEGSSASQRTGGSVCTSTSGSSMPYRFETNYSAWLKFEVVNMSCMVL